MIDRAIKTFQHVNSKNIISNSYIFCSILFIALTVRIIWLILMENDLGIDAVRYLWISEHVSRREWKLLPQLYTSPLLPLLVGSTSWVTGENLWTGRIICILGNTLAVGLAMLLVRKGFPQRPALAWLTGLCLSFNHVWARLSPFVLTDNLFYPEIIGLLLLFLCLLQDPTVVKGLAFGGLWSLTYLTRDIGLYCGGVLFFVLIASRLWITRDTKNFFFQAIKLSSSILTVLFIIGGLWVYWYYCAFGIISLGEGPRFYLAGTNAITTGEHSLRYNNGTLGFFRFRPYEFMHYTRTPLPGDERYPAKQPWNYLFDYDIVWKRISNNIRFTLIEFKLASIPGIIGLILLLFKRSFSGPIGLTLVSSLLVLGLHLISQVRDARQIGWFFPWIFLGLAGLTLWFWDLIQSKVTNKFIKNWLSLVLIGLFCFHVLYPQYFREVPRRWAVRHLPNSHQWASAEILKHSGPGAVISAVFPQVAYRSRGFWIHFPAGTAVEQVEWLYLGKADYLLIDDSCSTITEPNIFWEPIEIISQQFPELKLVAEFTNLENKTYRTKARLFRFIPDLKKFAALKTKYPWAGTHPRTTGAWAPESSKMAPPEKPIKN